MVLIYNKSPEVRHFTISPEPGNLIAEGLGGLPDFISAQNGGLGEATAADFGGLKRVLGDRANLVIPNWKHLYMNNWKAHYEATTGDTGLTQDELYERWSQIRTLTPTNGLILIDSKWFNDQRAIYGNKGLGGENIDNKIAVAFQENARNVLKSKISENQGRDIFAFQDQKQGPLMAYLQTRDIKPALLLRVHNGHTDKIPLSLYDDMNVDRIRPALYIVGGGYGDSSDTLATSIKNAFMIEFVGEEFLRRVKDGEFLSWNIFEPSFTYETKIKYDMGQVRVVPNGVSPTKFAENISSLTAPYTPQSSRIVAKQKSNKIQVQKDLGLPIDDKANLFFSTARLAEQKKPQTYPPAIRALLNKDKHAQVIIIGDVAGDGDILHARYELEELARTHSRVVFRPYKNNGVIARNLFATGSWSFGSSTYEPFGFTDVDNHINGGLSIFTAVDGFKDKTVPLTVEQLKQAHSVLSYFATDDLNKLKEAPKAIEELRSKKLFGNGVLFNNADSSGLYWGFEQATEISAYLQTNPQAHEGLARLIMLDARDKFSNERMIQKKLQIIDETEKAFVDNGWWPTTADKAFNPYAPSNLEQKKLDAIENAAKKEKLSELTSALLLRTKSLEKD